MKTISSILNGDSPKVDYFEDMKLDEKLIFIHNELTRYGCPEAYRMRIISNWELLEQFQNWYNYFNFKHSGDALPPSYIQKRNSFNYWLGSFQYHAGTGEKSLDHSANKHRDEKNQNRHTF